MVQQKLLTDYFHSSKTATDGADEVSLTPSSSNGLPVHQPSSSSGVDNKDREYDQNPVSNQSSLEMKGFTETVRRARKTTHIYFTASKEKKRKRRMLDDPRQMILDAGQKKIGVQHCSECDMVYDYDTKAERIRHDLFHNRFKDTEWFRVHAKQLDTWLKREWHKASSSGVTFCVTESSIRSLKKRVENVVIECVNEEIGYATDLVDVWESSRERQAWTYISYQTSSTNYPFIGAIALVENASKVLMNMYNENCPNDGPLMGVNRLWVHRCLRRQGIAEQLLDQARTQFLLSEVLPRERVAFNELTQNGAAFARKYCPNGNIIVYSSNVKPCVSDRE